MSFKIEKIRAFISVGPDEDEGICSASHPVFGQMPLICADEARFKSLYPMALAFARESKTRIKVVEFSIRTDLEEVP